MYLRKLAIAVSTTGVATNEDYSTGVESGVVYAVQHIAGTVVTTGSFTLRPEGDTSLTYLTKAATTNSWILYPRANIVDSTAGSQSTDTPVTMMPIVRDRFKLSLTGCTSSEATATINIFLQGA